MRSITTRFSYLVWPFLLATLMTLILVGCRGRASRRANRPPQLELIDTLQNLDTIGQDEIVEVSFRVRNTGGQELKLIVYKPDCDCLSVRTPELRIAPGKQARLRTTFSARGFHGDVMKVLRFETNDSLKSTKDVYIYATVRSPFQFEVQEKH